MPIDPREKTLNEIVDRFVVNHGRADTPLKMAETICAYERDLCAAEREIDRLKRQISAGYIRRDISHHYEPGWTPKKPLPDAVTDEWISTGKEAA
jgi:hypothetical protein